MTWPVPVPGQIASRAAAVYESTPGLEGIDARSEASLAAASTRVLEGATFDLYLYQANLAQELMPDTAQDELPRHGNIWGVPRLQASGSVGAATFTASVAGAIVVPAGFTLTAPSGVVVTTTASVAIAAGASMAVPLAGQASDGAAGNLAAGIVLQAVSPLSGLNPQGAIVTATPDGSGLSGGAPIEDLEAWRSRILARIQAPAMGGSAIDYQTWAKQALDTVSYVAVQKNWVGLGTVAVVVAMAGPRVPTTTEIGIIAAYIATRQPVTAAVTVLGATLLPVNFSIHLNPDTVSIRAAATTALQLAFVSDSVIGGTGYVSRYDDALSSASGEYSHERVAPAADVVPAATQLLTLGVITWV